MGEEIKAEGSELDKAMAASEDVLVKALGQVEHQTQRVVADHYDQTQDELINQLQDVVDKFKEAIGPEQVVEMMKLNDMVTEATAAMRFVLLRGLADGTQRDWDDTIGFVVDADLRQRLQNNFNRNDWVDVMNLAAILWWRSKNLYELDNKQEATKD